MEKILQYIANEIEEAAFLSILKQKIIKSICDTDNSCDFPNMIEILVGLKTKVLNCFVFLQCINDDGMFDSLQYLQNKEQIIRNAKECLASNAVIDMDRLQKIYLGLWYKERLRSDAAEKLDNDDSLIIDKIVNPRNMTCEEEREIKEITDAAVNKEKITKLYIYYRYHRIYDEELFAIFCEMLGFAEKTTEPSAVSFITIGLTNYAKILMSQIYQEVTKDIEGFSRNVYKDFWDTVAVYPSFIMYKPEEDLTRYIEKIINTKELGNPNGPNGGKIYDSANNIYKKRLTEKVRSEVIIKLDTNYTKVKKGSPNLRTIRANSSKLTVKFHLETPYRVQEQYVNKIEYCPSWLVEELWSCLKKYGIRGYNSEKINSDPESIIDTPRIMLMGRLYILVLLAYAFARGNYDENEEFRDIVKRSVANKQVSELLKIYSILSVDPKEKEIISDIMDR